MRRKVVLIELNEVPWRVIERYAQMRPTSALKRVLQQSRSFTTHAPDHQLSPWTTWSSVHRGVSDQQHGIADFGQELASVNERFPTLWKLGADAGLCVGNCGSLHTYPLPEYVASCAFWIPDVFAPRHDSKPDEAQIFQEINLKMSRESARNVSRRIPAGLAARLLLSAPKLGITSRTVSRVMAQLAAELAKPTIKSRRRTFQSIIAFDVFMRQLERKSPDFCSFFTNHVASAMHRYWAAAFPEDYPENRYASEWRNAFAGEIDWAMDAFDHMLRRLVRFVERDPDYSIWIASSMGQAAVDSSQIKRQVLIADVGRFMSALGFAPHEWERRPAMEPRVILKVSGRRTRDFAELAGSVHIVGKHSIACTDVGDGVFRLHPGVIQDASEEFCILDNRRVPFAELGFANVAIEDEAGQSAYHVPEGSLVIYSSTAVSGTQPREQVSTLEIAPAILRTLGVVAPRYMVDTRIAA